MVCMPARSSIFPLRIGIVGAALLISLLTTAFHKSGVEITRPFTVGIILCPKSLIVCFSRLLKGHTKAAASLSLIRCMLCCFAIKYATASPFLCEATIASPGKTTRCMHAGLMSMLVLRAHVPVAATDAWREAHFLENLRNI